MSDSATAAGVLLAAGAGTRYGMPKVLAHGGRWLHACVAALADGGCDDVVVVLGAAEVDVPAPARAVIAQDWEDGLSASVRAGIGSFVNCAQAASWPAAAGPALRMRRGAAGVAVITSRSRTDVFPKAHITRPSLPSPARSIV